MENLNYKNNPNHTDNLNNNEIIICNNDILSIIQNSKLLISKNEYEKAIANLDNGLGIDNQNIELYLLKGKALKKSKQYNEAILNYEQCSLTNTGLDYIPIYLKLGRLFDKLKNHQEAQNCYEVALGINEDDYDTILNQGISFYLVKDFQNAINCIRKAISINPNYYKGYDYLAKLFIHTDIDQAFNKILDCINLNSNYAEAYSTKAHILIKKGEYYEALNSCIQGLEIMKDSSNLYIAKGLALQKLKKIKEATDCFRIAIEYDQENDYAILELGKLLFEEGYLEEAFETLDEISEESDETLIVKGKCLLLLDKYSLALEKFENALKITVNNEDIFYFQGEALRHMKKYNEALESYKKTISLNINYFDAYISQALIYEDNNKFPEAIEIYEKLLKLEIPNIDYLLDEAKERYKLLKDNNRPKHINYNYEKNEGSVKLFEKIGEGGYSVIYRGEFDKTEVAIKTYDLQSYNYSYSTVEREIEIHEQIRNPYIIRFLGFYKTLNSINLIFEYYKGGDLYKLLHSSTHLSLECRLSILLDISSGINYLHGKVPQYIHRDLKSSNILLSSEIKDGTLSKAVVSDLGIAHINYDLKTQLISKCFNQIGTPLWSAPELLTFSRINKKLLTKLDVYSFGIIIWEVFSRKKPYCHIVSMDKFYFYKLISEQNIRPLISQLEDITPTQIVNLIEACWNSNPELRPSFGEIILILKKIKESLNLNF